MGVRWQDGEGEGVVEEGGREGCRGVAEWVRKCWSLGHLRFLWVSGCPYVKCHGGSERAKAQAAHWQRTSGPGVCLCGPHPARHEFLVDI